jgi:drug/metabolite transporter (DMT)-like permease
MIKLRNDWRLLPSLAAMVLWGLWAFLPKLAMQTMSPQSVIFYEALGNILVAVPIFFFLKRKLIVDKKGITLTACSSAISMVAILTYYYALRLGPVATIVTVTAMYPIIGLALARIFLKEKMNRIQLLAVAMAMAAVGLLAG